MKVAHEVNFKSENNLYSIHFQFSLERLFYRNFFLQFFLFLNRLACCKWCDMYLTENEFFLNFYKKTLKNKNEDLRRLIIIFTKNPKIAASNSNMVLLFIQICEGHSPKKLPCVCSFYRYSSFSTNFWVRNCLMTPSTTRDSPTNKVAQLFYLYSLWASSVRDWHKCDMNKMWTIKRVICKCKSFIDF